MTILHWSCSRIDALSCMTVVASYYHVLYISQLHRLDFVLSWNLIPTSKLEIETLSAIFAIKTPRCDCCFVPVMWLIYMTFKWVPLIIFPWTQSNLNLEIKKRLNFDDFFMASDVFNISNMNEIRNIGANNPLDFLFWNISKKIDLSFVRITKPLSNKIEETFCEGLKWMCKLFEKNGQKDV